MQPTRRRMNVLHQNPALCPHSLFLDRDGVARSVQMIGQNSIEMLGRRCRIDNLTIPYDHLFVFRLVLPLLMSLERLI